MNTRNTILNELRDVAPGLVNIPRGTIYTVPAGYFENLADKLSARVMQDEQEFSFSPVNPYAVPPVYFDGLAADILSKIHREQLTTFNEVETELNEIAPVLNTISKQPVYSLPAGYFENLQPITNRQTHAKVASLSKFRRLVKYAAAAVITGIVATGAILFSNKPVTDKDLPVAKIQEYHPEDVQKLSETDIAEFLDTHSSAGDVASVSNTSTDNQDMDIENSIEDISDTDLQQFLKDNPEPGT